MSSSNHALNNTLASESIDSNTDIAGIGIIVSFIVTAGLSMILSGSSLFMECFGKKCQIIHKTLFSLSNQQIITGIGFLSLGIRDLNRLTYYHFYILWALSILSTITNSSAVCALANEIKIDWVVRWIQQLFLGINFTLYIICSAVLFWAELVDPNQQSLSIDSLFKLPLRPFGDHQDTGTRIWDIVKKLYILYAVAFHYINFKLSRKNLKSYKNCPWILCWKILLFVLNIFVVYIVIRSIVTQSYAFGSPSVVLSDNKEKEWDFGQTIPILLLILPFISAIESYREQKRGLKHNDEIEDQPSIYEDQPSTYEEKPQRFSYQPSPFSRNIKKIFDSWFKNDDFSNSVNF